MKCVMEETGIVSKVSDQEAELLVTRKGYKYVNRAKWKARNILMVREKRKGERRIQERCYMHPEQAKDLEAHGWAPVEKPKVVKEKKNGKRSKGK